MQKDVQINASQWVQKISVGPRELEKKNEQYKNGKGITYLYADVLQLKLHVMWKVFQLLISSQNVRAYISKKNLNAENVVIWNLSAYIKEKILYAENVFKLVYL